MNLISEYSFPDIETASAEGLLAIGADLEPATLLEAYSHGIFPWFSENDPIMWWSLNPRMILYTNELHISKSLKRVIKSKKYSVSYDTDFEEVINRCAEIDRGNENGVWITSEMKKAYLKIHKMGYAHSVEVRKENLLVGGLYGICLGKIFFGESMFHTMPDASKVALYALTEKLRTMDIELIDCQQETEHMERMGARSIARKDFKNLLEQAIKHKTHRYMWT